MNTILVATDGSQAAREAVEFGVALAAEHDAAVVFVHVAPRLDRVPMSAFGMVGAVPHEPTAGDYEVLEKAEAVAEEHGVRARSKVLAGDVADEIVAYADDIGADLTVVGSRGRGTVTSALLGSASHQVLAESRRPVAIIKGVASLEVEPALTLVR
jgi:nucleotide-binding universal stress UspA family protein